MSDDSPGAPRTLQPPGWPRPRGYANGMAARGRLVVTGGLVGWDEREQLAFGFVAQCRQALANVKAVLAEAGARPHHLVRLTWYVVDAEEYLAARAPLGVAYREVLGAHYPAMAVVEVRRLIEPGARVEIEATAVVPDGPGEGEAG